MRPSIRISVILWAVLLLAGLCYVTSRVLAFTRIFFAHSGIAVTQREAYDLYHNGTWSAANRTQYIPKIIHQVFHNWNDPDNETLPADWDGVRQTCIDKNPDFEYRLWSAKTSRALIAEHYPFFLRTYDGYPHAIQRVDAARYFILLHHGGVYLDLDNGCRTDLTPLLYFPTWTCDPGRGALSNNILATAPGHPFWMYLTQELMRYDRNWVFPYVTISWASGQWFESAVWEGWHDMLPSLSGSSSSSSLAEVTKMASSSSSKGEQGIGRDGDGGRLYRIMMDDREGADEWVFFTQERGGTWINWDNRMFLWIGDHLGLFVVMLLGFTAAAGFVGARVARRVRAAAARRRKGGYDYESLENQ